MNKLEVIVQTVEFVKKKLSNDTSGHDWWHIYRVWQNAKHIGQKEKADLFIVELGALLHDIADWKFHDGDFTKGPQVAGKWLEKCGVEKEIIDRVKHIVENVSFKGAKVKSKMKSLEGKVVQDADRLDAIGAIGIGRCFTYGGYAGVEMYNPDQKPVLHKSFEEYSKSHSSSINHFYEKLLLLKNLMNTKTGKRLAQRRHVFMKLYLREFLQEWQVVR